MRNIKKLTESDLNRIVKKVINEQYDEMNSKELYELYFGEINSELNNIDDSYRALRQIYNNIEIEENLDEEDKNDLISFIENNT